MVAAWRSTMKRGCLLVFILLTLVLAGGYAQDYKGKARVTGYVYDPEGNPVPEVRVKLFSPKVGQGFELTTDKEGKWVAAWIQSGAWNIDFEKPGFAPKSIAVELFELKKNPDIKVNLIKAEGSLVTEEVRPELNRGNQLFDEKKYDEAIAVFQGILEKYPDLYIIYKNIGNCYFEQEKYDLAEEAYQKILEKDPNDSEAERLIGNCYANRGEQDKALEWYGKIDFEKLKDPIVLYNIGNSYYNVSKFEDALRYYSKSVEIQPDFSDGLYQLGLTYLAMTKNPEAISAFEDYLKVDPDSERANQVKGFLEFLKKQ
jgi:tetratricopeptide (TPR) repeat protein